MSKTAEYILNLSKSKVMDIVVYSAIDKLSQDEVVALHEELYRKASFDTTLPWEIRDKMSNLAGGISICFLNNNKKFN